MITTLDFMNAYIYKLHKLKINSFKKTELVNQYNFFMHEYPDFFAENNINKTIIDFYRCGYFFSVDGEDLYVVKNVKENQINPFLDILMEYYTNTQKLSKEYGNMIIYLADSNKRYIKLNGKTYLHNIEWKLFTDGKINSSGIKLVKGTKHTFVSPFTNKIILLKESDFDYVNVTDASYVLEQEYIDDQLHSSLLYTESNSMAEIKKLTKTYCSKSR